MNIARTAFVFACMAAAGSCVATERASPLQGPPVQGSPLHGWAAGSTPALIAVAGSPSAADTGVQGRDVLAAAVADSGALGLPVDAARLQELRGGESTVDNQVLIDGSVGNNVAEDVVTGANAINGDAFANASGISTVIQNTGNNVLIQNGMVVNVQFVGP